MKIVILGSNGNSTYIVYERLKREFDDVSLIIENSVSSIQLLKRRVKKLGLRKVIGQILFKVLIVPYLKLESRKRRKEIFKQNNIHLENFNPDQKNIYRVESVNSDECRKLLSDLCPEFVVVNGTRIIGQETIQSIKVPMINLHVGITPKYRGVHGGYWALANDDRENCGVTIHWINEGIDTGRIICQQRISYTERDNFCTYPYLQTIAGAELEVKVIRDYEAGQLNEQTNQLPSKLWSHPTLAEYLKMRKKGVK